MLRSALLSLALVAAAGQAAAQDGADTGEIGESGVDFILRPTANAAGDAFLDGIWAAQTPPEEPDTVGAIGAPMAGPTANEPVGPALAGPAPAQPVQPAQPRPADRRAEELEPFAATGKRLGTFILRPAIELGVSFSDNPAGTEERKSAVGLIVAPELSAISEDEDHEIAAELRGEAILYGEQELDEREAEARIRARYDLSDQTSVDAEAGYVYELDRFTDPDTPAAAAERPPVHNFDAALGITREAGRIGVGLAGTVEREIHEDVPLADGGTASRAELDNTEYGLRLRTFYAGETALRPFVEAAVGQRDFDQEIDDSGFRRASVWGELRGGLIFDLGSKLNGEVSAGWRREDIDDERLEDIDALTAAAAILWSPRRLTEVRFDFLTEIQPTSIADVSGSVLYSGTFSVARRLSARLRAEAGGGLDHERFVGLDRDDVTYFGYAELSYSFNRTAALKARYTYERTDSTDPAADAEENMVGLRLRLQR